MKPTSHTKVSTTSSTHSVRPSTDLSFASHGSRSSPFQTAPTAQSKRVSPIAVGSKHISSISLSYAKSKTHTQAIKPATQHHSRHFTTNENVNPFAFDDFSSDEHNGSRSADDNLGKEHEQTIVDPNVTKMVQADAPLSKKQFRQLIDLTLSPPLIDAISSKVPAAYVQCRGCGVKLQYEEPDSPGFIPGPNFQSYLLRLDLQLRAAQQDLRIRSGGGKGQGTAVAALHASLKSSLRDVQLDIEARRGKIGRFTSELLQDMGLDENLQPLPKPPRYDQDGNVIPEPTPVPQIINRQKTQLLRYERDMKLRELMSDPKADINEINRLKNLVISDNAFLGKNPEHQIPEHQILDKKDVEMLEKAAKLAARPAKCQRCHRMAARQFTAAEENSGHSLKAEDFIKLLKDEFQGPNAKPSIIIKVVDVLDFHGSFIQDLPKLTGSRNPIIIAVNKCDVLPHTVSPQQVQSWVKKEITKHGVIPHSIFTISAHTGRGVDELIEKALLLARGKNDPSAPKNRNIYIMGTTNVGKSTLVNHLLKKSVIGTGLPNDVTAFGTATAAAAANQKQKKNVYKTDLFDPNQQELEEVIDSKTLDQELDEELTKVEDTKPRHILDVAKRHRDEPDVNKVVADIDVKGINTAAIDAVLPTKYLVEHQKEIQLREAVSTTSPIPGTTQGIISFPVLEKKRGGRNLFIRDTPGVMNSWQLSSHLKYDELKRVLPTKKMTPLTYRIQTGQSILLGGLARVDMIAGKPFQISSFVSSQVSVHIAASHRINRKYLQEQLGVNLIPPFDSDARAEELSIFENIANEDNRESEALRHLQQSAKAEFEESTGRSKRSIEDRLDKIGGGVGSNSIDDKRIAEEIPIPKRGTDNLAHLRADVRTKISEALGELVPLSENLGTSIPARTFIDNRGRIIIQLLGDGFIDASHDVVIAGLGWISLTGSGPLTLRISIAGENARLTPYEMKAIAKMAQDMQSNDEVIPMDSVIDPTGGDDHNHSRDEFTPAALARSQSFLTLSARVRRILSRVSIRDPLVVSQARHGQKWTGVPEAVKHTLTREMQYKRAELIKIAENRRLAEKYPEKYAIDLGPDEIPTSALGHDNLARYGKYQPIQLDSTGNVVDPRFVKERYFLDDKDIQRDSFDAYPSPPPVAPSKETPEEKEKRLEREKQYKRHNIVQQEWDEIEKFHQQRSKQLESMVQSSVNQSRKTDPDSLAALVHKKKQSLHQESDSDDVFSASDLDYLEDDGYTDVEKAGRSAKKASRQPKQQYYDDDSDDDNDTDFGDNTDDDFTDFSDFRDEVQYSDHDEQPQTYRRLRPRADSDVEQSEVDELANNPFRQVGVPTGPQGKLEKGGRRARKVMGLLNDKDKYEDIREAQKNILMKTIQRETRKTIRAEREREKRDEMKERLERRRERHKRRHDERMQGREVEKKYGIKVDRSKVKVSDEVFKEAMDKFSEKYVGSRSKDRPQHGDHDDSNPDAIPFGSSKNVHHRQRGSGYQKTWKKSGNNSAPRRDRM